MPTKVQMISRPAGVTLLAVLLAGCSATGPRQFDWDFRANTAGNTSEAARQLTESRPRADNRGIISYPGYQIVIARPGENVNAIAGRLGLNATELSATNAIPPDVILRGGEALVLPRRVAEPGAIIGGNSMAPAGTVDVGTIATTALDRVSPSTSTTPTSPFQTATAGGTQRGVEPARHTVKRGETGFTVARLYNVTPSALADWNGLNADLALREGQILLIPPTDSRRAATAPAAAPSRPAVSTTAPGQGTATPQPPSATKPLPAEKPARAGGGNVDNAPAAPSIPTTAASAGRLAMPVDGKVIRAYQKGKYDGIGIGAATGTPVRAAADGTVVAITRDTGQVPIMVISHANNLLTVYANVDGITATKGSKISRGQQIGTVRAGNPAFLHFEVRRGADSIDPMSMM